MYQQVPAGAVLANRTAVYVTEHRLKYTKVVDIKKTSSKSVTRIDCPDRTLHIVTNEGGRPDEELKCPIRSSSFDYVVYLDPYSSISATQRYTKRILVSAATGLRTGVKYADYIPKGTTPVIDSGGAQLRMGTANFISPFMIIDWMNNVGGEGMALDVPPRIIDYQNEVTLEKAAQVQRTNNRIFKKLRDKKRVTSLLNVSHGYTLEQMRRWMDVVADDSFDGLAAGSDRTDSLMLVMRSILAPALEGPVERQRNRLHLFGIGGGMAIPACVWLAKLLPDADFTTDSTSWLVGCNFGAYYILTDKTSMHQVTLWKAGADKHFLSHMALPCSCEVCSAVRWVDVLRHKSYATGLLLSFHNLFVLKQYENMWSTYAGDSRDLRDYSEPIKAMGSKKSTEILGTVQYIDHAVKYGLDSAEKKFAAALSSNYYDDERVFEDDDEEFSLLSSNTHKMTQLDELDSVNHILSYYRGKRLKSFLKGTDPGPSKYAIGTGYEMTCRLIQKNKNQQKKADAVKENSDV